MNQPIIKKISARKINVVNKSTMPVGCAITNKIDDTANNIPNILFSLAPQEIKHLGINIDGSEPQYLWLLNLQTKASLVQPFLIIPNITILNIDMVGSDWKINTQV